MFVQSEGIYRAYPAAWAVEQVKSGAVQLAVQFSITDVKEKGEWVVMEQPEEITGYFYIVKKDGTLNDRQIQSIKDALGWDGVSFANLASGDWSGTQVQITVGSEVYEGKKRLKVQWLNHRDYEGGGGVGQTDPQIVSSLDTRFGSALRATAGTAKPAAPATNGAVDDPNKMLRQRALAKFKAENPNIEKDAAADEFKKLLAATFGERDVRTITAEEWANVEEAITIPF